MSDTEDSELEELRQRKMEELQEQAETPAVPDEPVHLDAADEFDDAVAAHDVVLVDFYADWCGPCKTLEPVVERIAADTDATVLKVDIDDHQALARRMNVRSVPTLSLYVDGQQVEQLVGFQDEETLRRLVERHG